MTQKSEMLDRDKIIHQLIMVDSSPLPLKLRTMYNKEDIFCHRETGLRQLAKVSEIRRLMVDHENSIESELNHNRSCKVKIIK